jgi:hypothetical protein
MAAAASKSTLLTVTDQPSSVSIVEPSGKGSSRVPSPSLDCDSDSSSGWWSRPRRRCSPRPHRRPSWSSRSLQCRRRRRHSRPTRCRSRAAGRATRPGTDRRQVPPTYPALRRRRSGGRDRGPAVLRTRGRVAGGRRRARRRSRMPARRRTGRRSARRARRRSGRWARVWLSGLVARWDRWFRCRHGHNVDDRRRSEVVQRRARKRSLTSAKSGSAASTRSNS